MVDVLGDRMKHYEQIEAGRVFIPCIPIIARMDGRSFHNFTKGMRRPFDVDLHNCFYYTVKELIKETNALIGYTQSDEITLVWLQELTTDRGWFNNKISKMMSLLASSTTLHFNEAVKKYMPEFAFRRPMFDARVWQVPNKSEAANCILWRELDATKNSISMAASHYYSPGELFGKNSNERQEMLFQKGVNWNDYPDSFKRGTYVRRENVVERFTTEELSKLPLLHHARLNPELTIKRSVIRSIYMPPFSKVVNKEGVIFDGEKPRVKLDVSGHPM